MTPVPAGSEPAGFVMGPELYLFILGIVATLFVAGIFFWLLAQRGEEGGTNDTLSSDSRSGSDD